MLASLRLRLPLAALASHTLSRSLALSAVPSLAMASAPSTEARNPKARMFSTGPPASPSGIDLYSFRTPNGLQMNVALEELANLGVPVEWKEHTINISKNEQKEQWYLSEINPNGRIPAIVDRSHDNIRVFETGSILLYLSKVYDTDFKLHFEDLADETEMWSWVFFKHGGYAPMAGQAGHFLNAAPVKDVYAARRYIDEAKRLLSVYETQLSQGDGRDYLVGSGRGKFSYADIASFPWIRGHPSSLAIPSLAEAGFPALDAWVRRIEARPGSAKAIEGDFIGKLKSEKGWEEKVREKGRWVWEEKGEERKRDEL